MDIYIYFAFQEEINIDDLEDEVDKLLGDKGEVTGRGMGISGGNIDVELYDEKKLKHFLGELHELKFPNDTYYVIDGVRKELFLDNKAD